MRDAGVNVHSPEGGFYLFPDFTPFAGKFAARGINTSQELCMKLLEDKCVALLSGDSFGMPEDNLTVRLAYITFNGTEALALAKSVDEIPLSSLDKEFSLIKEGVSRIKDWLAD